MKKNFLLSFGMAAMIGLTASAQVKLHGVAQNNRYDDGDQMKSEYLGWDSNLSKAIFIVDNGLWAMTWDGSSLSTPEREPAVNKAEVMASAEKKLWATNFNMMYGNSGAVYVKGKVYTITSRDEQSTEDDVLFAVRKWDAVTGDLLSGAEDYYPKSAYLESAGMSYNPKDGKVYGLFYLTEASLPEEILNDEEYFSDEDDQEMGRDGVDAGYCLCTIDLETMTVTPITKGLYYYNFITFAINSEGRAFALTSGGTSNNAVNAEGKVVDSDGNLSGAQLYEFNLKTGNIYAQPVYKEDEEGEPYIDYLPTVGGTGYCSQYRRQSACFSHSNPNKMYWNGYVNSGKGYNDWGSWSSLSDKEWRTNGKYDTALYEVDINTGEATQLSKIKNRWVFSAMWVDGDDPSDKAGDIVPEPEPDPEPQPGPGPDPDPEEETPTGITHVNTAAGQSQMFNLQGQSINGAKGLYIVKQNGKMRKVLVR